MKVQVSGPKFLHGTHWKSCIKRITKSAAIAGRWFSAWRGGWFPAAGFRLFPEDGMFFGGIENLHLPLVT